MHIDQLTEGNWTIEEALDAVATHYNAPACCKCNGTVLINRGGTQGNVFGWVEPNNDDLDAILSRIV